MTVTCPQCGTRYNLTPKQLGPSGRNLKCARCGNQWFVPPAAPAQPDTDLPPPLPPVNTLGLEDLGGFATAGRTPMWRRKLAPMLPWLAVAAVMLGAATYIGYSIFLAPKPTTGPAPITTPQPQTLELRGLTRDVSQQGNLTILRIAGTLTNTGNTAAALPELRVQLLDARGVELDFWPAELGKTTLAPKETIPWQARFLNPPLERLSTYRAFFTENPAKAHSSPAVAPAAAKTQPPAQPIENVNLSPTTVAPILTPAPTAPKH
jgi:predicted Zn finger-like uncharacterized protein